MLAAFNIVSFYSSGSREEPVNSVHSINYAVNRDISRENMCNP